MSQSAIVWSLEPVRSRFSLLGQNETQRISFSWASIVCVARVLLFSSVSHLPENSVWLGKIMFQVEVKEVSHHEHSVVPN